MKTYKAVICCVLLFIAGLLLSACTPKAPQKSEPVVAAKTVVALATATVEAKAPAKATNTSAPQPTAVPPTAAPKAAPTKEPVQTVSANLLLDPALAEDADSLKLNAYLYSGLVRLDASGKPEPALATSWVISEDGLDYIFNLRGDVTFSDGAKLNADLVKANFDRWLDPASPLRGDGAYAAWKRTFLGFLGEKDEQKRPKSSVDGVEKVGEFTVLVHLNRPVPELLTYLADPAFAMLSPEALKSGSYGKRGAAIVPSGPYTVGTWTEKEITLVPNPTYWDKAAEKELKFVVK